MFREVHFSLCLNIIFKPISPMDFVNKENNRASGNGVMTVIDLVQ